MKLRTIGEKVRESKPAAWFRTCRTISVVHSFIRLCKENPFPVQCALLLVYRSMLDFTYVTQLSPLYSYSGFTTDITPIGYCLSWLMLLTVLPLVAGIQGQEDRPSSVLVTMLNLIYFIPMTSYAGCKGSSYLFMISALVYWLVLLVLQLWMPSFALKRLPHRRGKLLFTVLTVGAVLLVMGISGVYTGFRLKLNLSDVYDVRAEAAAYDMPTILSYALSWMTMVLSVLILYWLQAKKYLAVLGLVVVYFFYYSIGAHKSVFFFLFLLLACYILYRSWMFRWSAGLLSLGVMACWLMEAVGGFLLPMAVFVRRFMYTPVRLSETYATFFSQHPINLLRNGIMARFGFEPVYSTGIAALIGEFNGSGANANNGMLGDMYANLPVILGIVLFPLILVIIFRMFDLAASTLPGKIFVSFCVFFAASFSNSAWPTVLLTHGFLMACLLLYLFPVNKEGVIREVS